MTAEDREYIRQASIGAALQAGALRIQCPDYPRCHYAISGSNRFDVKATMADHLANDPRHTGGTWIDRDGIERIGLEPPCV